MFIRMCVSVCIFECMSVLEMYVCLFLHSCVHVCLHVCSRYLLLNIDAQPTYWNETMVLDVQLSG